MNVEALLASARAWKADQQDEERAAQERAIVCAAKNGDHEALAAAVATAGVNLDCAPGFDGNTPLHWAVEKGHVECVRVLASRGATIDAREKWQGWTPLMLAASKDRRREAEVLLAHGASVGASAKGITAADIAASAEMRAMLQAAIAPAAPAAPPRLSRFWKLHAEWEALVERAEDSGVLSDEDWQSVVPGVPMSWITDSEDAGVIRSMLGDLRRVLMAKDATFRTHGYNLRQRRGRHDG